VLGTAQFGLDYGINNKREQIPKEEIYQILNLAIKNKIRLLDTSPNYGNSEKILGSYIKNNNTSFKIITKTSASNKNKLKLSLTQSLKRLKVKRLYGYLFHNFETFKKRSELIETMQTFKTQKLIENIGFSLYFPNQLDYLLQNKINFDIIQLPYNIFDQRFSPYFSKLKKMNVEIHTRSVFLQGLFFSEVKMLDSFFQKVKVKISSLRSLSANTGIPIYALCMYFVLSEKNIDHLVIGIDSEKHIKQLLSAQQYRDKVKPLLTQLATYREENVSVIIPANWKRK